MFMVAGGKYPKSSRKGKSLIDFERGWKASPWDSPFGISFYRLDIYTTKEQLQ